MRNPFSVCVIGMGPIGNRHAGIYQDNALAKLVGVCDRIKTRADAAAAKFGVPAFYDADKMLCTLQPDLCSITTGGYEYSSDHYEPTMQALDAGCHILGEKPISNEISKAEEMVAKAQEKGVCYGINLNHRFTPAAYLAKRWQNEGLIGHLLFVNMGMWIKNPAESSPWYMIKALNPHTVDIMRYFGGDIEAVQCFAQQAPGRSIWSTAHFSMRYKNGAVGGLTASYDIERGHPMERCEVAGLKGRFVIDDMWREVTLYPAGSIEKRVYSNPVFGGMRDFEDTFRNRINKFLEEVSSDVSPDQIDGSGADGLAAQKVLQAAIESIETESVVNIK